MTRDEKIETLKSILNSIPIDKDADSEKFHDWRENAINKFEQIFGAESKKVSRFRQLPFKPTSFVRMSKREAQGDRTFYDDRNKKDAEDAFEQGCRQVQQMIREWIEIVEQEQDPAPVQPITPQKAKQVEAEKSPPTESDRLTKETKIEKLNEALEFTLRDYLIPPLGQAIDGLYDWRDNTIEVLGEIFGKQSSKCKRFEAIRFKSDSILAGHVQQFEFFISGRDAARDILMECLVEIESDGQIMNPKTNVGSRTNIIHNSGILQLDSHNSHQTVTTTTVTNEMHQHIQAVKAAVAGSEELTNDTKFDINHELDHVAEIAKRERSESNIRQINEKLTTVEKMLNVATKLAPIVGPAVAAIRSHYHI